MSHPEATPARVLVIKLGALGDCVLASGAVRALRAAHPHARLGVLTGTGAPAAFFARCPWVDTILTDPRRSRWNPWAMARLRRAIAAFAPDRVYDFQESRRTEHYFRSLAPKGVEWSGTARGCSHPHHGEDPHALPVLARHAGQLRDAGLAITTLTPEVGWLAQDPPLALPTAFCALMPASSARRPEKRWAGYQALLAPLRARGLTPITFPGPGEQAMCQALGAPMGLRPNQEALSLPELAGALAKARLLIGNDTGPTHLGAWLGRPAVGVFGARQSPERACFTQAPATRALHADRMDTIAPAAVLAAADALLTATSG